MKTFKRIDVISGEVEKLFQGKTDYVVADIGTDHGYIAEKLSKICGVKKVVATDISEKSLSKLQKLIIKDNLKKIETICGDGLNPINQVDACVVAGIGGEEIIKMLKTQNHDADGKNKCNIFVLQPSQNIRELRKYVFSQHIYVYDDYVFEDNQRFYHIIAIDLSKKQKNKQSVYNLYIGRDTDLNCNDAKMYLCELKVFLSFIDDIELSRIKCDKILFEKYKLKKIVEKILK